MAPGFHADRSRRTMKQMDPALCRRWSGIIETAGGQFGPGQVRLQFAPNGWRYYGYDNGNLAGVPELANRSGEFIAAPADS
jgi:hypothetical protein